MQLAVEASSRPPRGAHLSKEGPLKRAEESKHHEADGTRAPEDKRADCGDRQAGEEKDPHRRDALLAALLV